jgi:threonine dehydrogenase-like Zn-dependent dehydrogenase
LEPLPRPEAREAGTIVVQIKPCGFCASDYKAIRGIRRNVRFPAILGHEPSGVVAQGGPGVTHFKVGDEVICQPSGFCGFCEHCGVGNTHYCEHAFTTRGDGPEDVWHGAGDAKGRIYTIIPGGAGPCVGGGGTGRSCGVDGRLAAAGHQVAPIITHRLPLSELHEALEVMAGRERTKVIVKP